MAAKGDTRPSRAFLDTDLLSLAKQKGGRSASTAAVIDGFYGPLTENTLVKVVYINDTVGKGMFAARDIEEGEELYQDRPLARSQTNREKVRACQNCIRFLGPAAGYQGTASESQSEVESASISGEGSTLESLEDPPIEPVACRENCGYEFCCVECEAEAWREHHRLLCVGPELGHSERQRNMRQFYRKAGKLGKFAYWDLVARVMASTITAWQDNGKDWEKAWLPYALLRKMPIWEGTPPDEEREMRAAVEACLAPFKAALMEPGIEHMFELNFFASVLGINELNCTGLMVEGPRRNVKNASPADKLIAEGVCLCPVQATTNHSCDPNAAYYLMEDSRGLYAVLTVKALRALADGEEISVSYVEESEDYQTRRAHLMRNYRFECICTKCVADAKDESHRAPGSSGKKKRFH